MNRKEGLKLLELKLKNKNLIKHSLAVEACMKIIGGQIVSDSECSIKHIDTIAVAIRSGWTALNLATLRCAGQPELSPDPEKEPLSLAAEDILQKAGFKVLEQNIISKEGPLVTTGYKGKLKQDTDNG